jgi:predicted dehydrogenase
MTVGWGVIGTGRVARDFAEGLRSIPGARLVAVCSKQKQNADTFARIWRADHATSTCEDLVTNAKVDVVYVATPHAMHKHHAALALDAGKAVLCEKPFTASGAEALAVIKLARQRKLFCMEAMWMHFLPAMRKAIEMIQSGVIGEPQMLTADFGVPTRFDPHNRFFDAKQGGGAMLDRGVYPIALAWRLFGKPDKVEALCALGATGVDTTSAVIMRYASGPIAMLGGTLTGYGSNEAVIVGTEGRITIHEPLCRPDSFSIARAPLSSAEASAIEKPALKERLRSSALLRLLRRFLPGRERHVRVPYQGNGYNYEAEEVMRCIKSGVIESEVWPLDSTAGVMEILDSIRVAAIRVENP